MQRRISAWEVKQQVQTQTEGLIIKSRDINENDTVVKILTGDLGLISAFANGTKKVKSRTASAAVSPMTYSRLTLYRGREVVERNIPQEEALDRLVELIKADGAWQEP